MVGLGWKTFLKKKKKIGRLENPIRRFSKKIGIKRLLFQKRS